jgi:hypothetical protein
MDRRKLYRIRHAEQGLCNYCSNPVSYIGSRRCVKHSLIQRKYAAKYKTNLMEKGLCRSCSGQMTEIDIGHNECINCREKLRKPRWKEYQNSITNIRTTQRT